MRKARIGIIFSKKGIILILGIIVIIAIVVIMVT